MENLIQELGIDLQSQNWMECSKLGDFYGQCKFKLQGFEIVK